MIFLSLWTNSLWHNPILLLSSNEKYNEFYLFENFKVVSQDLHVAAYGFLMKQRSTLRKGLDSGQWA